MSDKDGEESPTETSLTTKRLWVAIAFTQALYVASLFLILAGLWMVWPFFLGASLAVIVLYLLAAHTGARLPFVRALIALVMGGLAGALAGQFLPDSIDPNRVTAVFLGCGVCLAAAMPIAPRRIAVLRLMFVVVGAVILAAWPDMDYDGPSSYIAVLVLPTLLGAWEHLTLRQVG